jgi:hypothetical protein
VAGEHTLDQPNSRSESPTSAQSRTLLATAAVPPLLRLAIDVLVFRFNPAFFRSVQLPQRSCDVIHWIGLAFALLANIEDRWRNQPASLGLLKVPKTDGP